MTENEGKAQHNNKDGVQESKGILSFLPVSNFLNKYKPFLNLCMTFACFYSTMTDFRQWRVNVEG